MIRRTIALAGATALTLGVMGLAGPAAADDSVGIASGHVDINEFGMLITVDIQSNGVELHNTTSNPVSLNNWALNGCSPTDTLSEIASFGPDDEIPANGFFVIGDNNFDTTHPMKADVVDSRVEKLEQSAGGLELVDASSVRVDSLSWGSPTDTTCDGFLDVGVLPDDDETVQFDGTSWCRAPETFGAANTVDCGS